MYTPAPAARGLKDRDDTADLTDAELTERAQRCQQEQSRRLAAAQAAVRGREPLRKEG